MLRNTARGARRYKSITSFSYIDNDFLSTVNRKEISSHLQNLGPFPSYSNILNPQHFYQNQVLLEYLQRDPHPVSLRQLAGYGKKLSKQKIIDSANFVRIELPIRLALRIRDLQTLPFGIVNNFHLAHIYESYYHLFNAFRKIPSIRSLEENDKFCTIISQLLDDHITNLAHLMMGSLEVSLLTDIGQSELDTFMSQMLRSRMSRRLIVEEHLSLTQSYRDSPNSVKPPHYIGEIFHNCKASDHLNIVSEAVKRSMLEIFPSKENMPDLEIDGDLNSTFQFIEPHLHYLFGEILRNSYEATIMTHGLHTSKKLPPVKVTIIDSKRQVIFRISDRGGGMPHDKLKNIWSFRKQPEMARKSLSNFHRIPGLSPYTGHEVTPGGSSVVRSVPATSEILKSTSLGDSHFVPNSKQSTLDQLFNRPYEYKLGLGLPVCKVYTDYWNGDLQMNSLEGYGSDTCLTLSKLGYHSNVVQLDRA